MAFHREIISSSASSALANGRTSAPSSLRKGRSYILEWPKCKSEVRKTCFAIEWALLGIEPQDSSPIYAIRSRADGSHPRALLCLLTPDADPLNASINDRHTCLLVRAAANFLSSVLSSTVLEKKPAFNSFVLRPPGVGFALRASIDICSLDLPCMPSLFSKIFLP